MDDYYYCWYYYCKLVFETMWRMRATHVEKKVNDIGIGFSNRKSSISQ